ncbi:hypothetical protein QYF36_009773 [Acer negundo]|nr:hypothetical protein QYF36_009773 [Acer negundo]
MEEKQKYARAVNEAEGYGSDRIVSDKQVHDWSHRLSLKVFPQRKRRLNLWPQIPQDFRSGITILLQDKEVEGLQILVDGKWYRVPVIPHALVVNLGYQMQIMSNGIYKSPMHRVVTNTEKLRISVTSFIEPDLDNEIGPVEHLIDEQRPRLYGNVKNYGIINYECYQKGLVALETVQSPFLSPSD